MPIRNATTKSRTFITTTIPDRMQPFVDNNDMNRTMNSNRVPFTPTATLTSIAHITKEMSVRHKAPPLSI
jgi:hypothetical protein